MTTNTNPTIPLHQCLFLSIEDFFTSMLYMFSVASSSYWQIQNKIVGRWVLFAFFSAPAQQICHLGPYQQSKSDSPNAPWWSLFPRKSTSTIKQTIWSSRLNSLPIPMILGCRLCRGRIIGIGREFSLDNQMVCFIVLVDLRWNRDHHGAFGESDLLCW